MTACRGSDSLGGPQEVDAVAPLRRQLCQFDQGVHAGDPFSHRCAEQSRCPDQALTIGKIKRRLVQDLRELRVPLGRGNELGVDGVDLVRTAFCNEPLYPGQRLLVCHAVNPDAQDVDRSVAGHVLVRSGAGAQVERRGPGEREGADSTLSLEPPQQARRRRLMMGNYDALLREPCRGHLPSRAEILPRRRRCRSSPEKSLPSQTLTTSAARPEPTTLPPRQRMLASLCSRLIRAE